MNKKELQKQTSISMAKFLAEYVGVQEDALEFLSSLSHQEFKQYCTYFKKIELARISFEAVDRADLLTGDVLLVKDHYHNLAPYLNPKPLTEIERTPCGTSFTYDDYIDSIELVMGDPNTKDQKIRTLGSNKNIEKS